MTNQEFLENIFEDPSNDNNKLIYADWLEEQGDPLGEIIRIQLEIKNNDLYAENYSKLVIREQQLLAKSNFECYQGIPKWFISNDLPISLRITKLIDLASIISNPCLENVINLDVKNININNLIFDHLLNSPHIINLKHLNVNCNKITKIPTSNFLKKLQTLEIAFNELNSINSNTSNLKVLDISSNGINNNIFNKLINSPYLENLKELNISFNHITDISSMKLDLQTLIIIGLKIPQNQIIKLENKGIKVII